MFTNMFRSWADLLQILPLVNSIILTAAYGIWFEPAKFLYWLGATVLTVGIILMR